MKLLLVFLAGALLSSAASEVARRGGDFEQEGSGDVTRERPDITSPAVPLEDGSGDDTVTRERPDATVTIATRERPGGAVTQATSGRIRKTNCKCYLKAVSNKGRQMKHPVHSLVNNAGPNPATLSTPYEKSCHDISRQCAAHCADAGKRYFSDGVSFQVEKGWLAGKSLGEYTCSRLRLSSGQVKVGMMSHTSCGEWGFGYYDAYKDALTLTETLCCRKQERFSWKYEATECGGKTNPDDVFG